MCNFSPQLFTSQYRGTLVILQELLANPRSTLPEVLIPSPRRVFPAPLTVAQGKGTQQSGQLLLSLGLASRVPAMLLSAMTRALATSGCGCSQGRLGMGGLGVKKEGRGAGDMQVLTWVSQCRCPPTPGTFSKSVVPRS